MNPEAHFNYYTEKATELKSEVMALMRSTKVDLSKSELKQGLSRSIQAFLDFDRPKFLDVTLKNLVNRDGLLESSSKGSFDVFRLKRARRHLTREIPPATY